MPSNIQRHSGRTIADPAIARVLVAALRGYGFHPLARDLDGPPGMPGYTGVRGLPVEVPQGEAADARPLVAALLTDMQAGRKSAT